MSYRTLLTAGILAGVTTVTTPLLAHEVQIQDDVGATLHIEPNDIPLAGTPTDVWFALTKAGGTLIPLADCECRLTLYDSDQTVVESPDLTPVSAEGLTNIPGAKVTFPDVGAYELVLSGAPQGTTEFSPFELRYEVTVAGRANATATAEADAPAIAESDESSAPVGEGAETVPPEAEQSESVEIAESTETPSTAVSSTVWRRWLFRGGALLVFGIVVGIISNLILSGEKS
ncbi:hypothetical protein PN498_12545 [Oscillatoria sp. CS-180]|nr:hypothetical protein [Oscillatoria sp. CS-180]